MKEYSNWRFLLTPICNARCFFCHRDGSGEETEATFLQMDDFENIVKEYGTQMEKVRLSGGDPFLHPQLLKMAKRILEVTDDVSIGTNGLLLSKYHDQILESGVRKITVSVHSMNPKTYSEIMKIKPDKLINVTDSIDRLNEIIKFKINVVALNGLNTSDKEIRDLLEYAIKNQLNMEFVELDLGSIFDLNFDKFHYSPELLVEKVEKILGKKLRYDKVESTWGVVVDESLIKIQRCHCYNKLCDLCVVCRPIIVYPNGDMNRCRMVTPYVKSISGEF